MLLQAGPAHLHLHLGLAHGSRHHPPGGYTGLMIIIVMIVIIIVMIVMIVMTVCCSWRTPVTPPTSRTSRGSPTGTVSTSSWSPCPPSVSQQMANPEYWQLLAFPPKYDCFKCQEPYLFPPPPVCHLTLKAVMLYKQDIISVTQASSLTIEPQSVPRHPGWVWSVCDGAGYNE